MELAPAIHRITTPLPFRPRSVHAYLIGTPSDGWILVDGGVNTDEGWAALDAGVRTVAGDWSGVGLHLVTHMHVDHIGLAARVRAVAPAPLAMGELDADRARHAAEDPAEEAAYRAGLLRECGVPEGALGGPRTGPETLSSFVPASYRLPCADTPLPGAPDWVALWTPGHTAGHVSLFRPADRVLVAGDAVLATITPTIGVNRQRADPVGDYLGTLDRLSRLDPALVLAGHGEPMDRPRDRILALARETSAESERIRALVGAEPRTAWEIARARYPERELPPSAWMQALRETLAHLQHLQHTAQIRSRLRDLVRFWLI